MLSQGAIDTCSNVNKQVDNKGKRFFLALFYDKILLDYAFIENNAFLMNEQERITLWELPHFIFCVFLLPC